MRSPPAVRWGGLALLFAAATACQQEPPAPRYLYVVTCDARVDKLDTSAARKEASYDLAASALTAILPVGNQAIDGCLAYHPVFDTEGALLYFVSPRSRPRHVFYNQSVNVAEVMDTDRLHGSSLPRRHVVLEY